MFDLSNQGDDTKVEVDVAVSAAAVEEVRDQRMQSLLHCLTVGPHDIKYALPATNPPAGGDFDGRAFGNDA